MCHMFAGGGGCTGHPKESIPLGTGNPRGKGLRQVNTVGAEYFLYLVGFLAGPKYRTDPNGIIENGHTDILGFKTSHGDHEGW